MKACQNFPEKRRDIQVAGVLVPQFQKRGNRRKGFEPKVGRDLLQNLNLILVRAHGNGRENAWILRSLLNALLGQMRQGKIKIMGKGKGGNGAHEMRRGQRTARARVGMLNVEAVDLVGHLKILGRLLQLRTHSLLNKGQQHTDAHVPMYRSCGDHSL